MASRQHHKQLLKDFQQFVDKPREGVLLTPVRVNRPLATAESKFGGGPYPGNEEAWPECLECSAPLNFVIQLHKSRFPQMWFPEGRNLFQVYRCPNGECLPDNSDESDRTMLAQYVSTQPGQHQPLIHPDVDAAAFFNYFEEPPSEHRLVAETINDYPTFYEGCVSWWGDAWARFVEEYTTENEDEDDSFWNNEFRRLIPNHPGIKIAGLPSWLQMGFPPTCNCGREKTFVFQLSSLYDLSTTISIGDAGNIYYFACPACGEDSLESCWDCG